jgi:uncharacterized membrane protein YdbT with pleckstrin-like domain
MRAAQAATAGDKAAEQQLWRGGFSPKAMYGSWIFAAVVTVAAGIASALVPMPTTWLVAGAIVAVLWIVLLGKYLYARFSDDYTLTSQRLMNRHGIFRQKTDRIEIIDVDDVSFEQGLVQRMFGVGSIKVMSSDTTDPEFWMRGIDNVRVVADLIDNARREERRKRALYMENV